MASYSGTVGSDTITALPGDDDLLVGGPGADPLSDAAGDLLRGLDGADTLHGLAADDWLDGGAGSDVIEGGAGNDRITTDGDDAIDGGDGVLDLLVLGPGTTDRAIILGVPPLGTSAQILLDGVATGSLTRIELLSVQGGAGDDSLTGGSGPDALFGGPGDDTLATGSLAADLASGEAGDDLLIGGDGSQALRGGDGADTIDAGAGNDLLVDSYWGAYPGDGSFDTGSMTGVIITTGNPFLPPPIFPPSETFVGDDAGDLMRGGDGEDTLRSGAGTGADTLDGGAGFDLAILDRRTTAGAIRLDLSDPDGVATLSIDGVGAGSLTGIDVAFLALGGGSDSVTGTAAADTLFGGAGDDTLVGLDGADSVTGEAGDDIIRLGPGGGTADGREGDDVLVGGAGADTLLGDFFYALTPGADHLSGRDGADELRGGIGRDTLNGGDGDDVLWSDGGFVIFLGAGSGAETLRGGAGDDVLHHQSGVGRADGGAGTDRLDVSWAGSAEPLRLRLAGDGTLHGTLPLRAIGIEMVAAVGGQAADRFTAGDANDTLDGGGGDDRLRGGAGDNLLLGGAGDDRLLGEAGDDGLGGGDGNDLLFGGTGRDTLSGGDGADTLAGGTGADRMDGGPGDDLYIVDDVGDVAEEPGFPSGTDEVRATIDFTLGFNIENLTLRGAAREGTGNALANRLAGNAKDNLLEGLDGRDTLLGGAGGDTLVGGRGSDLLAGGGGRDAFRYLGPRDGGDTIQGFHPGRDSIEIAAAGYGAGLVAGQPLTAGQFEANGSGQATTPEARFIYDITTGWLRFDADGNGFAALRETVALIEGAPTLTAADIVII